VRPRTTPQKYFQEVKHPPSGMHGWMRATDNCLRVNETCASSKESRNLKRFRVFDSHKLAVLPVASLLLAITATAQFSPAPASPFAVGTLPDAIAVADFNADGIPDIAVANATSNDVTVLLGNGSGGFNPATGSPFAVGTSPDGIAAGDLNGDGKVDLAVANGGSNNLTLLLGDGSGGFSASSGGPVAVGTRPVSIAFGEFNGDGRPDLAVANASSNDITVLLETGAGGFVAAAGSPFAVGTLGPTALAAGDLNRDGKQDIAVGLTGTSMPLILQGNGSGGFTALNHPGPVAVGSVASILIADFTGDGIPDLATAFAAHIGGVNVWRGDGSGGFGTSVFGIMTEPWSIAATDFNDDGFEDLVFIETGPLVRVLLGDGSGKFNEAPGSPFGAGTPFEQNANSGVVAVGDFNKDGQPDIVATNRQGNSVTLLLNSFPYITGRPASLTFYSGTGQPAPPAIPVTVNSSPAGSAYTVNSNQPWLSASPASNATGGATTETISVNQSSLTAGTYSGTVRYSAPGFRDGKTAVTLNVANPSGTLGPAPGSPFAAGTNPASAATGDFNGDFKPDLAIVNSGSNDVTVLLGDGSGGFTAASGSPIAVGTNPRSVAVGDFNGDGKMDLAVANVSSDNVTVLLGNGAGGFTAASGSPFAVGGFAEFVTAADFNGDGLQDFAVAVGGPGSPTSNEVAVFLGDRLGGFSAAPGHPFQGFGELAPLLMAAGDFNGDGKPDLAVAAQRSTSGTVTILLGNGSGGFSEAAGSPSFVLVPVSVTVGDFNQDGIQDLGVVSGYNNNVTVLLGNGTGGFSAAAGSPFPVGSSAGAGAAGDFNGDGILDLVVPSSLNSATVLLGNGSGGFTAGGSFAAGTSPKSVAVADLSGDGRPDLAVVDADNITVLLGALAATGSTLTTTSPSTISFGTSVALTLNVSATAPAFNAPTGKATFSDGATVLGTATQSASPYSFTASGLSVGSHTLTASYGGDTRSLGSGSNSIAIQVNPGSQTVAVTDNFNGPALNTNLWRFVNPVGDGSYSLKGSRLQLNVPGGSNHDPAFGGVDNTVRVVQPIGNADFTVEAQFDSIPALQSQLEGIVVEQDSANHLSFTIGSTGSSIVIDARAVLAGSATVPAGGVVSIPEETKSLWLRVSRSGDTWTESWSPDGSKWAIAGSFSQPLTAGNIGPFAGNYNSAATAAPAFTAEVKYFGNTSVTGSFRARVRNRVHLTAPL
jgi:hypothetical protein